MSKEVLTAEQRKLVEENLGLVNKVIEDKFDYLYSFYGVEVCDYEQIGRMALCKAAQFYVPGKSKFSTFAYMMIRQALTEAVTKSYVVSSNEANLVSTIAVSDEDDVVPFGIDNLTDGEDFTDTTSFDVRDALRSFFNDRKVLPSQKKAAEAFLYFVSNGCSATEAGLRFGAQSPASARNLVAKGRKLLSSRKEFRCLWEESKVLAS